MTTPDSVRLWYRVVGQGAETVIIPAALYHRKSFDRLARGRRVVLFDPRRRGLSDTVPASKVSIETDLADLETIRKTVGAESFALIAWSALGMEYYLYALRFPGRVTRLVQLASLAPRRVPYWDLMKARQQARIDSAAQARLNVRGTSTGVRVSSGSVFRGLSSTAIATISQSRVPGKAFPSSLWSRA